MKPLIPFLSSHHAGKLIILVVLVIALPLVVLQALQANASNASGIRRVRFYVNGSLKCSDATSPYTCNWKVPNRANVTYSLEATAIDKKYNSATATLTVTSK